MLDFSELPDVSDQDLGLTEPGEFEYAGQMQARENALHHIFGPCHPRDQILSPNDPNLTINWAGGGIYQYPPRGNRDAWHYVTSGLSQPFPEDDSEELEEDEERYSGFGIELVISSPGECLWAADVLVNLVKYLLFQENAHLILPGDRFPCNGPLVRDSGTTLTHLVATTSTEYETEFLLPAGRCDLVHLVGATEQEIAHALELGEGTAGSLVLISVFQEMGVRFTSNPERKCLTLGDSFNATWTRIRSEMEEKWASSEDSER